MSLLYFFLKNLATFFCSSLSLSLSLFIAFTRVTPHLFYLSDLVSPLFFVNLPTKFFSFGCHPLEGVTRGGLPSASDATDALDSRKTQNDVFCEFYVQFDECR